MPGMVTCIVCLESRSLDRSAQCHEGHGMCKPCVTSYVTQTLMPHGTVSLFLRSMYTDIVFAIIRRLALTGRVRTMLFIHHYHILDCVTSTTNSSCTLQRTGICVRLFLSLLIKYCIVLGVCKPCCALEPAANQKRRVAPPPLPTRRVCCSSAFGSATDLSLG